MKQILLKKMYSIVLLFFPLQTYCLFSLNISDIKKTDLPLHVAIIGTGYVGIVSGSSLAELGHNVTCADIDQEKINQLNQGIMPLFEPGIKELVEKNINDKRLHFSSDLDTTISGADIVIIAVGTPMSDDGDADLSALMSVVKSIAKNLKSYKIICTKSTVPIGTNKKLKQMLCEMSNASDSFDVVSNPEFLREGSALQDFLFNNPIVIGSDSEKALAVMEHLYKPLVDNGTTLIKTNNFANAETIKYAWNAYSAIKILYVDQLSRLCSAVDANIETVTEGMSFSEKLLPIHCVKPGPGIGGSCLPKDTAALIAMSKKLDVEMSIVAEARRVNENHRIAIINDFENMLNDAIDGKKIAILGLSFKANTDDVRYSAAIDISRELLSRGACIYAYDPQAMNNMKKLIPEIHYCSSAAEALMSADALLLLTDWDEFKNLDLSHVAKIMAHPILMDTRNMFDPKELKRLNFNFKNLGYQANR